MNVRYRQNPIVFDHLLAHPEVSEHLRLASNVGVMALHGGIEKETDGIAAEIASRTGASLYLVHQSERLRWHVPSIQYDPGASEQLASFLDHIDVAVSVHGFGRRHLKRTVLVGGASDGLADEMSQRLRDTTTLNVLTGDEIPPGLKGRHPANPVNLPRGGGVQLELSHSCRHAPHVRPLIDAIAGFVLDRQ
ncbi:MAG: poly-gamma-glutamate hydrolase family protein [Acidimicrobiia bacterium]|nr:poly-gamma-glutamate hydrolase family protein [Acidimicrobiia bacterium]